MESCHEVFSLGYFKHADDSARATRAFGYLGIHTDGYNVS